MIVKDYIGKNPDRADYYYLITGCDLSKSCLDYFFALCKEYNLNSVEVWTSSILEAILYANYHDLLYAFFGVNMTQKRNDRIASIRRNISLKHNMRRDFLKPASHFTTNQERRELLENPWKKFEYQRVLIRSVYDTKYPINAYQEGNLRDGYFKAEIFDFYHNGLQVRAFPYKVTALVKAIDTLKETEVEAEIELEVIGCIPFENIITYDMIGDEYYAYPHLYCEFTNGSDPYEDIIYIDDYSQIFNKDNIIKIY